MSLTQLACEWELAVLVLHVCLMRGSQHHPCDMQNGNIALTSAAWRGIEIEHLDKVFYALEGRAFSAVFGEKMAWLAGVLCLAVYNGCRAQLCTCDCVYFFLCVCGPLSGGSASVLFFSHACLSEWSDASESLSFLIVK